MGKVQLNPYIFFKGNCREAMEFYKGVFNGEFSVQTYEDVGQPMKGLVGAVMHAKLENDDLVLFGSDTLKASDKATKISLCLTGTDEDKLRNIFEGLKVDGDVFQELKKEFWGDTFGSLTDKYGVDWMVNIVGPKNEAK